MQPPYACEIFLVTYYNLIAYLPVSTHDTDCCRIGNHRNGKEPDWPAARWRASIFRWKVGSLPIHLFYRHYFNECSWALIENFPRSRISTRTSRAYSRTFWKNLSRTDRVSTKKGADSITDMCEQRNCQGAWVRVCLILTKEGFLELLSLRQFWRGPWAWEHSHSASNCIYQIDIGA